MFCKQAKTFNKSTNGENGFTLVELMIALTLMGIIFSVIFSGFAAYMKGYKVTETTLQLQADSRLVLNKFENDVKNAVGVNKHTSTMFQLLTFGNKVKSSQSKPIYCTFYLYSKSKESNLSSPPTNEKYELRRFVSLDSIINYSDGQIIVQNVSPPPKTEFTCVRNSSGSWLIRLKLVLNKNDVSITSQGCYSIRN